MAAVGQTWHSILGPTEELGRKNQISSSTGSELVSIHPSHLVPGRKPGPRKDNSIPSLGCRPQLSPSSPPGRQTLLSMDSRLTRQELQGRPVHDGRLELSKDTAELERASTLVQGEEAGPGPEIFLWSRGLCSKVWKNEAHIQPSLKSLEALE